jgi:methionine-gamma-lyase
MTDKNAHEYSASTRIIHGPSHSARWDYGHHVVPPISYSAAYRLDSVERGLQGFTDFGGMVSDDGETPVYIYDRLDDPTRSLLESELAQLEGADACVTFSSGMGGISAALGALLKSGEHVIAHRLLYGCTHSFLENWLPRWNISVDRASFTDVESVRALIRPETRALYIETPVNPNLELIDIGAYRAVCDEHNAKRPAEEKIRIIVDNTFATPYGQRPLSLGADVVCHSLTKNLGGFGTQIGGAVMCSQDLLRDLLMFRKDIGASLAPMSAWGVLVYGLPSLAARIERQQRSAIQIAEWLEAHDAIERVIYPGLESFPQRELAEKQLRNPDGKYNPGNMIYFYVDEKQIDPIEFTNKIASEAYCITLAVSLGHVKTLLEMPAAMTHSSYCNDENIDRGVRISVGLRRTRRHHPRHRARPRHGPASQPPRAEPPFANPGQTQIREMPLLHRPRYAGCRATLRPQFAIQGLTQIREMPLLHRPRYAGCRATLRPQFAILGLTQIREV